MSRRAYPRRGHRGRTSRAGRGPGPGLHGHGVPAAGGQDIASGQEVDLGQVLELLATDPGVEPDMKAWSRRTGNELISIGAQDGVFHVLIRRVK